MTTSGRVRRGLVRRAQEAPTGATEKEHPLRLRFPDPELDREFRQQYDDAKPSLPVPFTSASS